MHISPITNPIIITTPRTGSTIVCEMLWNIAKDHYGHKNILYEYFTITDLYESRYQNIENCVQLVRYDRTKNPWCENRRKEMLSRIVLLGGDYKYTIKVFPSEVEPEILSIIKNKFDLIFLERRDKVRQLLSFSTMMLTNISHYYSDASKVEKVIYDPELTEKFFTMLEGYRNFKQANNGPTLYYEDFIQYGGDESALIKLLNLPIDNYNQVNPTFIPTPYSSDNMEDLIINKEEWKRDKALILDRLSQYS